MSFGMKLFLGLWGVVGVVVILGSIVGSQPRTAEQIAGDANRSSYGYASGCMSGDQFNRNAASWVSNVDWSQVAGSATFSHDIKIMMAGVKVMDEMKRLGTQACPDLAPIYNQYVAATAHSPTSVSSETTPKPHVAPSANHVSQSAASAACADLKRDRTITNPSLIAECAALKH